MTDKYKQNKIKLFKKCSDDEEIGDLIDKIYEDGFEDGENEGKPDCLNCGKGDCLNCRLD